MVDATFSLVDRRLRQQRLQSRSSLVINQSINQSNNQVLSIDLTLASAV